MAKLNPDIETFARIKVIGVGGSGKNAVDHMIRSRLDGIEFIVMNTDTQDLHHSLADKKIHLGKNLTKGLGAGMNPEIGKKAAEETKTEIQDVFKGADMVFIACGMGGGTGTGAAPVVARASKEQGILTIAIVTRPFFFEGNHRARIAEQGVKELEKEVDAIIVIPNDRLLSTADKNASFKSAFATCDEILRQAVEGISDLITKPGDINIDFADIRTIMADTGSALMGVGYGAGEGRAEYAASQAINSPLLETSINGARGVLFSIAGGEDLGIFEVQEAAKIITESVDKDAKIIFGTSTDDSLKKGEVRVTVIATGFPTSGSALRRLDPTPINDTPRPSISTPRPITPTQESIVPPPQPTPVTVAVREPEEQPQQQRQSTVIIEEDYEEDEDILSGDFDVPSFFRRKK